MLLPLPGRSPVVSPSAFVAATATLIGSVTVGAQSSLWYGTVARADLDLITIGERSNLQDGVVLHTDVGFVLSVGSGVSVGHNAILHGCTIEDDVLVGMGAVVMNGAVVGHGSLVGAGALIPAGVVIPPRSLVLGSPGKVRRETSEEEAAGIALNAQVYCDLARQHAAAG
jgi:carbonic anhydrase/acetyltransferase-like protein (isoleucine patch superfamily)